MTITSVDEGIALVLVSLASLSVLCLLCLRCKMKPKTIQEEAPIYDPQIFQREGSRFAVTRSKTVTRPNQMTTQNPGGCIVRVSQSRISQDEDRCEPTYVAPLPTVLYGNIIEESSASNVCDYENILTSLSNSDEDDYENSEFLKNLEDDEPDYVNTN